MKTSTVHLAKDIKQKRIYIEVKSVVIFFIVIGKGDRGIRIDDTAGLMEEKVRIYQYRIDNTTKLYKSGLVKVFVEIIMR